MITSFYNEYPSEQWKDCYNEFGGKETIYYVRKLSTLQSACPLYIWDLQPVITVPVDGMTADSAMPPAGTVLPTKCIKFQNLWFLSRLAVVFA